MNHKLTCLMFITTALVGCSTAPQIPIDGKYQQVFIEGKPTIETEFKNKSECEFWLRNSIKNLGKEAKELINAGIFKFQCSAKSLEKELPYTGYATRIITGEKIAMRFVSKNACLSNKKESERDNDAYSYDC